MIAKNKNKNKTKMKKQFIYFVLLLAIPFSMLSQTHIDIEDVEVEEEGSFDPKKAVVPFAVVTEAPRFRKCKKITGKELKECFEKTLDAYISKTLVYPKEYKTEAIETKVYVIFNIDREGKIVKIRTRSKRKDKELFEKEAIRVISNIPKLKPARQKGEKVTVSYSKVIYFSL
ncbi:tonB protein, putative [Kordia algicida OT-1]|uniref:TonB protein, putative n=2 Tax=Kordia TaxID=221065 RepID=A9E663_9FLAO|nr:tonB protein, putative [Kordia algicida OT-1]